MASRLRPTEETGTVAATKQSAQSIGPSWTERGGRNARLAMRDAIRRGDREAAMSISMVAEKAGLPAQASIGSYEARTAANLLGRQAAGRLMSEQQAALDAGRAGVGQTTPPAQGGTSSVLLPDGRTYVPGKGIALPGGLFQQVSMPQYEPGGQSTPPASGQAATTPPAAANTQPPAASTPPAPVAPGATPPPENPVTGSAVPSVSDVTTRLSQRGRPVPGIALQGLAGRQAFDANLQKSIETGGREISEGRFNNMLKEANRLGVSREQLLNRLQDMGGVSLPGSAVAPAPDTRSLDQRLADYDKQYLGGTGDLASMPDRLRTSAAAGRRAAAGMRTAAAEPAATPAAPAAPAVQATAPTTPAATPTTPTPAPPRSLASILGDRARLTAGKMAVRALQPGVNLERGGRALRQTTAGVVERLSPARPVTALGTAAGVSVAQSARNLRTARQTIATGAQTLLEQSRRNRESWRQAGRDFLGALSGGTSPR